MSDPKSPIDVDCPVCQTKGGEFCTTAKGVRCAHHWARVAKANGVVGPRLGGFIGASMSRQRGNERASARRARGQE